MSDLVPRRPQRIASMREAVAEVDRARQSMQSALRDSNDERHQTYFAPVLERLDLIVANERDGRTFALADDLSNARSAMRRLRLPDIDPDLVVPTPALKSLRAERSNLVEALDNALDAAAALGQRPRDIGTGAVYIERSEAAEALIRLDERLRALQETVGDLQAAAEEADWAAPVNHVTQVSLVSFPIAQMKVELSAARFETQVKTSLSAPAQVDMAALARAISTMKDVAEDLKQAVDALKPRLAAGVRMASGAVVTAAERSWRGFRTVATIVRRKFERQLPVAVITATFPIPEMVVIPAGFFLMGSPEREGGDDERPQHEVTFARPFAIGKYAVTVDEFAAFVAETGHDAGNSAYDWDGAKWKMIQGRNWRDPGFPQTGRHPVTCVSWVDATAYAKWLSAKTGQHYRLPSEAEWEYAARAGTTGAYWTGKSISPEQANFGKNDKGAVPVDSYAANPFGLYNVHGNVWEWVEDVWHENYAGAPIDGSVWTTGDGRLRVLRGGSWDNFAEVLRAALRFRDLPDNRFTTAGFRLARTLNP